MSSVFVWLIVLRVVGRGDGGGAGVPVRRALRDGIVGSMAAQQRCQGHRQHLRQAQRPR